MDWSANGWRSAFRIELRVQAIEFASRGWPVLPGTYPVDDHWAGRGDQAAEDRGTSDLLPAHPDWQERRAAEPEDVAALWSDHPYNLLVATGTAVDALEVQSRLGHRAASALRALGHPAPIVATPDGRWYFLTSAGQRLRPELADSGDVRLHSTGSWVPMPPTTFPHGVVHWRVKPEVCGWRLPPADVVHDALCAGIDAYEDVAGFAGAGR